jgi:hypothetical protein
MTTQIRCDDGLFSAGMLCDDSSSMVIVETAVQGQSVTGSRLALYDSLLWADGGRFQSPRFCLNYSFLFSLAVSAFGSSKAFLVHVKIADIN